MRFSQMFLGTVLLAPGILAGAKAGESIAKDQRPAFNKRDIVNTVWAQHENESITNAQFPFCIDRQLTKSYGDEFKDMIFLAHQLDQVGIRGVHHYNSGDFDQTRRMLDAFKAAGNGKKVAAVVLVNSENYRQAGGDTDPLAGVVNYWTKWLNDKKTTLCDHPNYARIDSHPVIPIYSGVGTSPEIWIQAVPRIEKNAYRCIWLYTLDGQKLKEVAPYLPGFDGITWYSPIERNELGGFKSYLKTHYPNKIFMPTAKPKWQPSDYGLTGVDTGLLTHTLRDTLNIALESGPDAICLNELAEFQEQSFVVPSYQIWDSYWRICEEKLRPFLGRSPKSRTQPELFLTAKMDALVGDVLEFEVLGFPISPSPAVELDLRLVDAKDKEVMAFQKRTLVCNAVKSELFRISSIKFASEMAVFPVLRYRWNGKEFGPLRFRSTRLWVGNCPTDEIWSTPVDRVRPEEVLFWAEMVGKDPEPRIVDPGRQVTSDGYERQRRWMMKDAIIAHEGGVVVVPEGDPQGLLLRRTLGNLNGYTHSKLLANGWEAADFDNSWALYHPPYAPPLRRLEVEVTQTEMKGVPYPGHPQCGADQYISEQPVRGMNSLPIYVVSDKKYLKPCSVPVAVININDKCFKTARQQFNASGLTSEAGIERIQTITVPQYRVPYFDYRFDEDHGRFCMDRSGYEHHGWMGGNGMENGGGSPFVATGYCFQNYAWKIWSLGPSRPPGCPEFKKDPDGTGYLRFNGKSDWVLLPPRSMMPYAETVELIVRPEKTNRRMVIFSGQGVRHDEGYIKMRIGLDPQLQVVVELPRTKASVTSGIALPENQWSHIAVVNDCREVRLYVNGKIRGKSNQVPLYNVFRQLSFIHLGLDSRGMNHSYSNWELDRAADYYQGGLRQVRITGRPILPEEFIRINNETSK